MLGSITILGEMPPFCFVCCKAIRDKKVSVASRMESSYVVKGFAYWKDATRSFKKHESCDFHKAAVSALADHHDVGALLNVAAVTQKEKNRAYFLKVLTSIHFLARQGLTLWGDGDEADSNLLQLLMLRGEDFPPMASFLEREQLKYTSHEVQNEALSIMALQILRSIAARIQEAVFYTVMVDETTDCANKE
eukprot:scpid76783/ scgid17808/ Zinc finger MYM-type protein 1